jgi:protein O-mannosyl-transferase
MTTVPSIDHDRRLAFTGSWTMAQRNTAEASPGHLGEARPSEQAIAASAPGSNAQPFRAAAMCLFLFCIVFWAFFPSTANSFINFDDPDYVTANPHIQVGLTLAGLKWAFVSIYAGNWHPLTWLSHMADCQVFGLRPWGHHLTSVLLHAVNAVLLFFLLHKLTRSTWRSLLVTALFGLHPLRVESVAWIAERKDVLSSCFGLLSLVCYAHYAEIRGPKPAPAVQGAASGFVLPSSFFYLLALLFLVLGLMSKPMLVTLPCLMLLLDFWPLGRMRNAGRTMPQAECGRQRLAKGSGGTMRRVPWHLLTEKVPFFLATAGAGVITYWAHQAGGHVEAMVELPLAARLGNALVSYSRYLGKLFWPVNLCAYYPHPGQWPATDIVLAGFVLLGLSFLVFRLRRGFPYLLMGWLWFLVSLTPVIGLVQVGAQAMADRYTYLPSIGLLVAIVWATTDLAKYLMGKSSAGARRDGASVLSPIKTSSNTDWSPTLPGSEGRPQTGAPLVVSLASLALIALCAALTRRQIALWQNSESVFRQALTVTERNDLAHNNLGQALLEQQRVQEAVDHFQQALQINPRSAEAHYNLGVGLFRRGNLALAASEFRSALALNPGYQEAHYNLGVTLVREGDVEGGITELREAVRLKPDDADATNGLLTALNLPNTQTNKPHSGNQP